MGLRDCGWASSELGVAIPLSKEEKILFPLVCITMVPVKKRNDGDSKNPILLLEMSSNCDILVTYFSLIYIKPVVM